MPTPFTIDPNDDIADYLYQRKMFFEHIGDAQRCKKGKAAVKNRHQCHLLTF